MPTLPTFLDPLGTHARRLARRSVEWRNRLVILWQTRERGRLAFWLASTLPIVVLGFMLRFGWVDHQHMETQRQRLADLRCLAQNVYFEARGESRTGQLAVAGVTMNRVASPRFPATVCGVVHETRWDATRKRFVGAFSWTEIERPSTPNGAEWQRAMESATAVYDHEETVPVGNALFYHASHVEPSWTRTKKRVAKIGRHVFYE
jgi:N-acetylmuramoyl-L-alanine amidase